MADLYRLLQSIQPVLTPAPLVSLSAKQGELTVSETASSSCLISAVPPVPPVPEQYIQPTESCYQQAPYRMFPLPPSTSTPLFALPPSKRMLSDEVVDQSHSNDVVPTMSNVAETKKSSATQRFAQPSSATVCIHDEVAALQKLNCSLEDDPALAADIMSLVGIGKVQETLKLDAGRAAPDFKKPELDEAMDIMLQGGLDSIHMASADITAQAMVASPTSNSCEVWKLISAFDAHFARVKLIAIEGDDIELALLSKKALDVITKLKNDDTIFEYNCFRAQAL